MYLPRFSSIQIAAFGLQRNIGKIGWPIPKSPAFIHVRTVYLCRPIVLPGEPVQLDKFGREVALSDE